MDDAAGGEVSFDSSAAIGRLPRIWLAITFVSLGVGLLLTFDPSFVDAHSTIVTLIPFVLLPSIGVAYTQMPAAGPATALTIVAVLSVVGWAVLVLDDERWVVLTCALYGLAFSIRGVAGLPLAAAITGIWTIAWALDDAPAWRLTIPISAFMVGVIGWNTFVRSRNEHDELARLVEELKATRADLAASERENGVLEERARVAGEIHDTLAQGFTSIVVLARSEMRSSGSSPSLARIESVATENLQSARRLVAAMGPAELDSSSLPEAMERHLESSGSDLGTHFDVVGTPRPLGGSRDVTLLRALQEAMLNVRNHARAGAVHVTLAYLPDVTVLDVVDDGVGFDIGDVADRGDLTGGQGLATVRHRITAVGGTMTVETEPGRGTALSVQIPGEASCR